MSGKQTRSKKKEAQETENVTPSTIAKRHIFFIEDNYVESGQDIRIERMRHPGTEDQAYFVFSKATKKTYEILQFNQPHRSWFINDTVSSNGKCNLLIPFDLTFFGLYYLYKNCSEKAIPLNQIKDDDYPKVMDIIDDLTDEMILKIADQKGSSNLRAFKFNKDKALAWLSLKTELVAEFLKQQNIQVSENAISANYVKEDKDENLQEDYLRYACGIVGSYIPEELKKELLDYLNVSETSVGVKRKSLPHSKNETPNAKKIKVETNISIISSPPLQQQAKEKKVTAKEKAMQKAASGTKSIASFFKK